MFYSKADLENFTKHSLERNCDEVLSHNLQFAWEEPHHSYFPTNFQDFSQHYSVSKRQ